MEVTLRESAGAGTTLSKGRYHAKLIAADAWGSTAFYTGDVLKRDGARVFHKGLQIFKNHLTETEQFERPEGNIDNLVGKLLTDAQFEEAGDDGPGLYADVEFYPSYVDRMAELKEDVGLSIRADGLTEPGERDGRFGPVLAAILKADSVDVVTRAGAGGKLTRILESDRGLAGTPITKENQSMTDVTKEDLEAGFATLSQAITAEIGKLPNLFAEAVKGVQAPAGTTTEHTPAAEVVEPTNTDTSTSTQTAAHTEPVVIDHAAIIEALRTNDLPAVAAGSIIADITAGKSLTDAVDAQIKLREAFVSSTPEGGVVSLKESDGSATGLARAIKILG